MKHRLLLLRHGIRKGESGQALILVLILLVVGSLVLLPALAISSTALKTGRGYETKTSELYSADAGIEAGMWRIKYDYLGNDYDAYDYDTEWEYETDDVNGMTAALTIQNVWIPTNVTLSGLGLTSADAEEIIESEKLVVTGSAGAIPGQPYNIKIDYTPTTSENLTVTSIGVWLPQGFEYTTGNSTLEDPSYILDDFYCVPSVSACPGGSAVVWTYYPEYPLFTSFPGVDPYAATMTAEIEFSYTPPADNPTAMPQAVAWITTELIDGSDSDYPISWDVDTRIFKITSEAGETSIQAYSSKAEMRQIGDAMSGEYVAIGNSLMLDNEWPYDQRDTLLASSSTEVTTIPEDGDAIEAHLYWTGWRSDSEIITILSDGCSDIDTNWSYASPTDWSVDSSAFTSHNIGGSDDARLLTLATAENIDGYVPGSVVMTWDQGTPLVFSDTCTNLNYWTNGSAWDERNYFRGNDNDGGADALLTLTTGLDLSASDDGTVTVSWDMWEDGTIGTGDGLDIAFSSDNGTSWSPYIEVFRDDIGSTPTEYSYSVNSTYWTNGFKMQFKLEGFTGSTTCYIDNIEVTPTYTSSDGLDFAFSTNNGATWSDNVEAFRGDQGASASEYVYYLPAAYHSDEFKMRFEVIGMGGPGQRVTLDDILIRDLPPDSEVEFFIDGEQVHFDSNGDPHAGASPLEATESYVLLNTWGYSYACHRTVSRLVETYPVNPGEEHHTGNAEYTVGDVSASTNNYLAHAGWSLIIVYASPSTAGHYLYLRDFFAYNGGSTNLDFDFDGSPGGDITDFIIPEPIRDRFGTITESVAARVTCFIGEGDNNYTGDSVTMTGQQSETSMYLYNTASPWNNVWNGASPDMSYPGIDVDTFEVLWSDGVLLPGDTSLHLDMDSGTDAWNFIYLILSVRSETVTSGTTHYAINYGG